MILVATITNWTIYPWLLYAESTVLHMRNSEIAEVSLYSFNSNQK